MSQNKALIQSSRIGLLLLILSFITTAFAETNFITNPTAKLSALPFDANLVKDPKYYEITSVDFELIEEDVLKKVPANVFLSLENDCSDLKPFTDEKTNNIINSFKNNGADENSTEITDPTEPVKSNSELDGAADEVGTVEVIVDKIINIGTKIWNIIKKSRPVVNTKMVYANALPYGIKCWDELEQWQAPRSAVYRAKYKNLFGFEVIRFDVRLMHSYGGRFSSVGRYITNAAVQYRDVRVAPGMFELNADVKVMNVLNVGTKTDPIAALQLNLEWTAKGINQIQNSANFVVYGDGRPSEVHN